jgi:hypothetical protein
MSDKQNQAMVNVHENMEAFGLRSFVKKDDVRQVLWDLHDRFSELSSIRFVLPDLSEVTISSKSSSERLYSKSNSQVDYELEMSVIKSPIEMRPADSRQLDWTMPDLKKED